VPVEPPPSPWRFPDATGADEHGLVGVGADLEPGTLLHAYRHGLFPMADPDEDDQIYWYAPDPRAVLPLDAFHVPRSLARVVRQGRYRLRTDEAFPAVVQACAEPAPGRTSTWISDDIEAVFTALHERGVAHSVECWDEEGATPGWLPRISSFDTSPTRSPAELRYVTHLTMRPPRRATSSRPPSSRRPP
jgi:leucyl/phenylalanyl-tRNA--protein transferase